MVEVVELVVETPRDLPETGWTTPPSNQSSFRKRVQLATLLTSPSGVVRPRRRVRKGW